MVRVIYQFSTSLMWVKFTPQLFIFLMYIKTGKFQQLLPAEARTVLNMSRVSNATVPEECMLALNQHWFPEIQYLYYYCEVNETRSIKEMPNRPDLTICTGFDCWESQLTFASKMVITDIMNIYRQKVAENKCQKWCEKNSKRVIFELRWTTKMETYAIAFSKNCSKNLQGSFEDPTIPEEFLPAYLEMASVSFFTRTGLQRELRKILWKLIDKNYLHDWDRKTSEFRRGQMTQFGCSYILRRKIDYYTTLGEDVKSGNVGFLTCVYYAPVEKLNPLSGTSNAQSCNIAIPAFSNGAVLNELGYYPSLCTNPLHLDERYANPACTCEPENVKFCSLYDTPNPITWQEKLYGLTFMIRSDKNETPDTLHVDLYLVNTYCNVPKNIPTGYAEGADIYNYNCTVKHEVYVLPNLKLCSNWNCEDSQLTDVTKLNILKYLNHQRHLVANGNCSDFCPHSCPHCTNRTYCNVANLRWHWFLEEKAADIVKTCSDSIVYQPEEFDSSPFRDPVVYESISLVFDLPASEGQTALGEIISKLFWRNVFNDWDDDNKFRRGNALWIGCSIIQRPNTIISQMEKELKLDNGVTTHMTCIYAGFHDTFDTSYGEPGTCCETCSSSKSSEALPCRINLVSNVPPYINLCTSTLLEITMSCEVNYCEDNKHNSKAWHKIFNGVTAYQHLNGSFSSYLRNANDDRAATEKPGSGHTSSPKKYLTKVLMKKYCWILVLVLLIVTAVLFLLLSLVFKYFSEGKIFRARLSIKTNVNRKKPKKRTRIQKSLVIIT